MSIGKTITEYSANSYRLWTSPFDELDLFRRDYFLTSLVEPVKGTKTMTRLGTVRFPSEPYRNIMANGGVQSEAIFDLARTAWMKNLNRREGQPRDPVEFECWEEIEYRTNRNSLGWAMLVYSAIKQMFDKAERPYPPELEAAFDRLTLRISKEDVTSLPEEEVGFAMMLAARRGANDASGQGAVDGG